MAGPPPSRIDLTYNLDIDDDDISYNNLVGTQENNPICLPTGADFPAPNPNANLVNYVRPTSHTVHIPDFTLKFEDTQRYPPELHVKDMEDNDWITEELRAEVLECCSSKDNIGNPNNHNQRSLGDFEEACLRLFPVGRVFASYKQLHQVSDMFLSSWAVKPTHPAKTIRCFFSAPHNKKDRKHEEQNRRRNNDISPKLEVRCPFYIGFNYVKKPSKNALPRVYYRVKITRNVPTHTCELNTASHREAVQKSGKLQPNLVGVAGIVDMLRQQPNLPCATLRPLIERYIPTYKASDAKFICNFRQRATKFILESPTDDPPTVHDVSYMVSNKALSAADEIMIGDSSIVRANLERTLQTVLQSGVAIWDAINFLQRVQKSSPGLVYDVKTDHLGRPEAVYWMLPEMRNDLLRFGDVLFLDACKKDMNRAGWPYIGPCVKDSENQVRVVAECLAITERNETYAWVLECMARDESNWKLDGLRLIFGDQLISDGLLQRLGIQESCILHGDYFHLLNKVFPEKLKHRYDSIRVHLQEMLDGDEDAWHRAYRTAKTILRNDPDAVAYLDKIHQDPSYYSAWKLKQVESNLYLRGSAPAEQNHSSLQAHLKDGGSFAIVKQIERLMKRQIHLNEKRCEEENKRNLKRGRFKTATAGQVGRDLVAARKSLSNFAFDMFKRASANRLQTKRDGDIVNVWSTKFPYEMRHQCKEFASYEHSARCSCDRRIAFGIQCKHEYAWDGQFVLRKWALRWWNQNTINATDVCPAAKTTFVATEDDGVLPSLIHPQIDSFNDDDQDFQDSEDATGGLDGTDPEGIEEPTEYSYSEVLGECENLVKLCLRDKDLLCSVMDTILTLQTRIRNGLSVQVSFQNRTASVDLEGSVGPVRTDDSIIAPGKVGAVNPAARATKRLAGRYETRNNYRRGKTVRSASSTSRRTSTLTMSNDQQYVNSRQATKLCSVCRGAGHQKKRCPRLTIWGSNPIDNRHDRDDLVKKLCTPGCWANEADPDETRPPAISVPKDCLGLILHRKLGTEKIECTILNKDGIPNEEYENYPFILSNVVAWISGSANRTVISLLGRTGSSSATASNAHDGWHDVGVVPRELLDKENQSSLANASEDRENKKRKASDVEVPTNTPAIGTNTVVGAAAEQHRQALAIALSQQQTLSQQHVLSHRQRMLSQHQMLTQLSQMSQHSIDPEPGMYFDTMGYGYRASNL